MLTGISTLASPLDSTVANHKAEGRYTDETRWSAWLTLDWADEGGGVRSESKSQEREGAACMIRSAYGPRQTASKQLQLKKTRGGE